jgi:dihydrolipoamide dehydrogenase
VPQRRLHSVQGATSLAIIIIIIIINELTNNPSQALLNASHKYHEAKHDLGKFGIAVKDVSVDVPKMIEIKSKTVVGLTSGIEGLFKKNKVDYFKGWGTITGKNSVAVKAIAGGADATLKTKNIIIATGSEPSSLPFLPVDEKRIVTSTGALDINKIPERLVLVGGGVIGLEMGSVWSRFGSKVTVIEFLDQIAFPSDREVSQQFQKILTKQGLAFEMKRKVTKADIGPKTITLHTEAADGGSPKSFEADVVLVSVGRRPYTKGLGLESVGLAVNKRGQIDVDDHLRTAVPNIFAIGDCVRGAMLAHKAEEEGAAVAETIAGSVGHVNYDAIPSVIYTHPEVAWVGKTEEELKAAGIKYKVGKFPMLANSRARANLDTDGFVKMLADAETDKLLGAHIISGSAGDLIQECALALEYGASAEDIARTSHAHPTLSEALKEAALAAYFKPLHI